jgi:hypothetical protein
MLAVAGALLMNTSVLVHAASQERLRVGDPLPPVRGSFLTGRNVALPAAASGKTSLLLLGFTYGSRHAVERWGEWSRKSMGGRRDVTLFEIPMIGGLGRLGRWFIDRGMRKGTPAELHESVITVYSDTGDWKRRLGVTDANEDDAFLILVDGQGIVRWMHHGPFDGEAARRLGGALASLTPPPES